MSLGLSVKNRIKGAVHFSEKILPQSVFNGLLKVSFGGYNRILRNNYLLQGRLRYANSEPEKWEMVQQVHSVMPYSLVGSGGLEATYEQCMRVLENKISGHFVELGVARGGCAALMGHTLFSREDLGAGRRLFLFDSYEGLPEPTEDDYLAEKSGTGNHVRPLPMGSCLGTLEDVQHLLFDVKKFDPQRIEFIKGWFDKTVPVHRGDVGAIAILRIDGDWYESTKVCLDGLYDQVSSGGAIIIDDYLSCFGCKKAVDEFIVYRNLTVEIQFDGRGGCYFIKP